MPSLVFSDRNVDFSGLSICVSDLSPLGPGYIEDLPSVAGLLTVGSVAEGCVRDQQHQFQLF